MAPDFFNISLRIKMFSLVHVVNTIMYLKQTGHRTHKCLYYMFLFSISFVDWL